VDPRYGLDAVGKEINLVVCFLLGNSMASEFYMPTFRNTLFRLHRRIGAYIPVYEDGTDGVF